MQFALSSSKCISKCNCAATPHLYARHYGPASPLQGYTPFSCGYDWVTHQRTLLDVFRLSEAGILPLQRVQRKACSPAYPSGTNSNHGCVDPFDDHKSTMPGLPLPCSANTAHCRPMYERWKLSAASLSGLPYLLPRLLLAF